MIEMYKYSRLLVFQFNVDDHSKQVWYLLYGSLSKPIFRNKRTIIERNLETIIIILSHKNFKDLLHIMKNIIATYTFFQFIVT